MKKENDCDLIELSNIRQKIFEMTQGKTDYELINHLLKQHRNPSYIRAGLLILLWWKYNTWLNTECGEFPSQQFFHYYWKNACKRAGMEDKEFNA